MEVSERLADLLEGVHATTPDRRLRVLVALADALGRRPPVRPDPVFRRRLRARLIAEAADNGR